MRGNIFDIKRYAIHDGPGIRTTVFLKGCNLHCRWCHNPESQSLEPTPMWQVHRLGEKEFREEKRVGYSITTGELWTELCKDQVFFEESSGGVTFSGGEPFLQPFFLLEMLKRCRAAHFHTCVDTAGAVKIGELEEICRYTDLFLYDIKTAEPDTFEKFIGQGYENVWSNLGRIVQYGAQVLIRIPVVPGVNDTAAGLSAIVGRLKTLPVLRRIELLPYHRTGADKYRRLGREYGMGDTAALTEAGITGIKEYFRENGYEVVE